MVTAPGRALCAAFMFQGLGRAPLTQAFRAVGFSTKRMMLPTGRSLYARAGDIPHVSRRAPRQRSTTAYMSSKVTQTDKVEVPKPRMEEEVDPGQVEGTDLRVLKYPHPALRAENEEIVEFTDDVKKLARDMFKVMYASKGVGLAAPQVGVNRRLMVFNPEGDESSWLDESILINPQIVAYGKGKVKDQEGCLSFPGMNGLVERANWVKIEALNPRGKKIKRKYTDYTARIFQHEYDHLDGTVYIDRLSEQEREKIQPALDKLIEEFGEGGEL